jgi:hypothetical protein
VIVVYHPLDSVFQQDDVEIDQEPEVEIEQSEVREQLGVIDWVQGFLAFDLDDYLGVDNKIRAEAHSSLTVR